MADCGSHSSKGKKKKKRAGVPKVRSQRPVARSRTKGEYSSEWQEIHFPQVVGQPYSIGQNVQIAPSRYEEMHDVAGFRKMSFNPVHHTVYEGTTERLPSGYTTALGVVSLPGSYTPDALSWLRSNVPLPPGTVLNDLAAMAFEHFEETTPVDTNLAVFIAELLVAVVDIIKSLQKLIKLLRRMGAYYKYELERLLKKGLSDQDSHWLAWNFAVKPFLSDCRKLICSAEKARKRLIWLQRHNGVPTIVRMRKQNAWQPKQTEFLFDTAQDYYTGFAPPPPLIPIVVSNATPINIYIRITEYKLDFAAQGLVLFEIPEWMLEQPPACDVVWQSMQGMFNPLEFLWELTPFSWLVDWFLSYQAKLWTNIGDISPIPDAKVLETSHSLKMTCRWELYSIHQETFEKTDLGNGSYRLYTRRPGLPFSEVLPFRIPWEWYNASILVALLSQWKRNR